MPLIALLREVAARDGHVSALVDAGGVYSYRALLASVDDLATELIRRGAKTVALRADNSAAWIIVDLACQQAGVCLIPLPGFFSAEQTAHALSDSGANFLIADAVPGADYLHSLPQLAITPLKGPLAVADRLPPATSKITYTSGSTAQPKGVCLSVAAQLATATAVNQALQDLDLTVHLAILPLATLLENVAGVYSALLRGACVCLPGLGELGWLGSSGLNIEALTACIDRYRPHSGILLPQLLRGLNRRAARGWRTPDSLRFLAVGGARVAAAQIREARAVGLPVYEGYGLSECASVLSLNTPAADRPGSAGRPLSHAAFRFVRGELRVAGQGFLGYLGEADRDRVAEVATGDLAELDSDGFLHLRGRSKNLLVSSYGRNISPEWLESEILGHPEILQCMVVGDDRPYCSALVLPAPGCGDAELAGLFQSINRELPDYARLCTWQRIPRPFSVADGLLTANGRLRRQPIIEHYAELIAACYEDAGNRHFLENPMSFYQRLQAETAVERQSLTQLAFIQRGLAGELGLDDYIAFLTQAYHHVKHTVPLLMACGSRLPESREWLREAVAEYIEEEVGHQEWILNDIAACGGDKEAVRNSCPGAAAELMVAYAYDAIQRGNPVGFFGMVQVLEGTSIAVADAAANAIQQSLGLPNKAFSYLKSHGALDIEHVQFFESLMDRVDDPADQQEIIHRAKMFYRLYGDIFRSLARPAPLAQVA